MQAESGFSVAEANSLPLDPEVLAIGRRPLKICILSYRSAPHGGGQGIYIKYLSKALADAGHEVDVISGQPYPHLDYPVNLIKMPGMNLYETGLGSLRPHHLRSMTNIIEWLGKLTGSFPEPLCFGRRVSKYLRANGRHYDIIFDNQSISWGTLGLQGSGFPLLTLIHHPVVNDLNIALGAAANWWERALLRRWYSFWRMQKKVVARLQHIVAVSETSKADIATAFGIEPQRIKRVHCGIDTVTFSPRPGITAKPFRLMATASADTPLKGVSYLLEAIAELVPRYPDIELLMVGKPRPGGETERLIDRLQLQQHIKIVSGISTEQLVEYYAEAQVAVVPSVYEGFGLPAGEAMACGVPLVATNGGALPEVVGDAGVQVPVRDSRALADAIAELFDNPEKRARLGAAGRQRIVEQFCWNKVASEMTEYYFDVLAERRLRADS